MSPIRCVHKHRAKRSPEPPQRGAAAVELALLLPLLALLLFGAIEYGFSWRSAGRVESAVGSAARVGAQTAEDVRSDWAMLQAVRGSLGNDAANVERVVIYNATSLDGLPAEACLTDTARSEGGVVGICNVYDADDLTMMTEAQYLAGSSVNGEVLATPAAEHWPWAGVQINEPTAEQRFR